MNSTHKTTAETNKSNYTPTISGLTEPQKISLDSPKAQQVQPSGKNLSQDIQNSKTIIDAAQLDHKATMRNSMDSEADPKEGISPTNTISSDETSQQGAWNPIPNTENMPEHTLENINNPALKISDKNSAAYHLTQQEEIDKAWICSYNKIGASSNQEQITLQFHLWKIIPKKYFKNEENNHLFNIISHLDTIDAQMNAAFFLIRYKATTYTKRDEYEAILDVCNLSINEPKNIKGIRSVLQAIIHDIQLNNRCDSEFQDIRNRASQLMQSLL